MKFRFESLKFIIMSLMILSIGIVIAVSITHLNSKPPESPITPVQKDADISAEKIHQTSIQNGVKEWTLDAASASFMNALKQIVFNDLTAVFFLKGENEIRLKADHGILKTDTQNIEVTGNVRITNEDYRLETEKIVYEQQTRSLSSLVPIKITGAAFDVAADSMTFDLNTNTTKLHGNVKGIIYENISF